MENNAVMDAIDGNDSFDENEVVLEEFVGDNIDYSGCFDTNKDFVSDLEAINYARVIANSKGFELKIGSHKEKGKRKLLACARGGRYKGKLRDMESAIRKNTKTKRCDCPFGIAVYELRGSSIWRIRTFPGTRGMHNHRLDVYRQRSKSGLCPEAKKLTRDMTSAQAKPCDIMTSIREKFPEDNVHKKQIYNYRAQLRMELSDGRSVVEQFYDLALKSNYVSFTHADPETRVMTHVFMAHPQSVNLFRTYPYVICMDSAYKTDRYKMSFLEIKGLTPTKKTFLIAYVLMKDESEWSYRWALQKLRFLIGDDVHPTAIVTNRELGLMKPVSVIFSQTSHLLCTWNMNKDVEDTVFSLVPSKGFVQQFKNLWEKVTEASTIDAYHKAVANLRDTMCGFQQVVSYIENTWCVHKEKFVWAWTNDVLHFGNTTCGAESEHNKLKQWINSSSESLDTVWTKVHNEIEFQITQIRHTLEKCSQKSGVQSNKYSLDYLTGHVTYHCLKLLENEMIEMKSLNDQVFERCTCILRRTHQLPCACELKRAVNSQILISVDRIHIFWKTFVIDEGVQRVSHDEDHKYFRKLIDEVSTKDQKFVQEIAFMINRVLHPDQGDYFEPHVKTGTSTSSGHDQGDYLEPHVKTGTSTSSGHDQGDYIGKTGISTSSGHGCSSSSVDYPYPKDASWLDINDYTAGHYIAPTIRPYVEGVGDVRKDGNCGFRVVAQCIFNDENEYVLVRNIIVGEINSNRTRYNRIYPNDLDTEISRIIWDGGRCLGDHWMTTPDDLFAVATLLNAAVFFFGFGNGDNHLLHCYTILPLHVWSITTQPRREIIIAHLGDTYPHYIRLYLLPDFPVPPIHPLWFSNHDHSVDGWDHIYDVRRRSWDSIRDSIRDSMS